LSIRPHNFRINDSHYSLVVRRPVAILMVTLAVGVFGFVSYQRLALTLMPDMSYPALTVRTTYPGTAPEEMENIISRPLEQQLGIIPKLVSISSVSKASQSDVILEFQWKTDMDLVAQEVREKIDRIRFPEGSQRPLLLHFDPSLDPILRLGLSGPQSLYELRHLAEYSVKRKLETLPGVAAIQIKGGLEEQYLVALDESKLSSLKLDIGQISSRLQQGNVNMSGGNLREGQTEYLIRTLNEFRSLEEIGTLIVARQNGIDIRLRDIATVSRFHEDRTIITRVNGHESVEIEVYKEADANVLVVAAAVKEAIYGTAEQQYYVAHPNDAPRPPPEKAAKGSKSQGSSSKKRGERSSADIALAQQLAGRTSAQNLVNHRKQTDFLAYQLPPDTNLQLLSDQSVFIRNSINEVQSNAISGGIIAIVVLFLFLRNLTQTLIVSLTIPISILATFAPMHMSGISLNIISLGGLALGVGSLVDNAIVVLESIFRCREEGDDAVAAVVRGTSEVAMPVVASTLTTVAVFFPIVFVEGVAGQVFGDMALTVVFSQLASLISALYLIPMLAGKAAGATVAISANSPDGLSSPTVVSRGSGVLQFPARGDRNRFGHALYLTGIVLVRVLLGLVLILAVAVKAVALLVGFALAPLWLMVDVIRRQPRLWSGFAAWAETDQLGPIHSLRIWPGMLCFTAVTRFGRDITAIARWFIARPWRWIALLAVPVIVVGAMYLTRSMGWWATAPGAPVGPPAIIPVAGLPLASAAPWYDGLLKWFKLQPWWVIVPVCVPGVLPFVFVIARYVVEVALRLCGTTVQTIGLSVVQALIGTFKAVGLILAPPTTVALNAFERGNNALQRKYPDILAVTLRHRFVVLGASAAALAVAVFLVLPRLGSDLIPQVHQGEFNIDVTLPIGTPITRTADMAERVDLMVREQDDVARTAITIGAEEGASTSVDAGEHTARITVRMRPDSDAKREMDLIDRVRAEFRNVPEVKLEISYPALFSFKSPIELEIRGHDLTILKRLSREAEDVLATTVPGLVDIRSSLQTGHPEIQVIYNRDRLAEYGLNLRSVADLVRTKVQGRPATQFRQEDQMVDIVVRLREEDRFGLDELKRLVVNPNGNVPIALSAVADLTVNEGPSQIRRVDQQRTALITANTRGSDLATISTDIVNAMETLAYPAGFSYNLAGQNKEMKTSLNSLLLAFGLAAFLVYIVMASQFESLVQPLIIMMTIPLALIGVIFVLWMASIPVTIMVFLGLIILVGIVVNNAIVLIDYINTLRGRGMEKTAAIVEAGRARLRPILMTAMTTIVGLIPMALGLGEGAEIRAPMAITVIVGLSTATVLTLVVIPALYFQFTSNRALPTPGESAPQIPKQPEPAPLGK